MQRRGGHADDVHTPGDSSGETRAEEVGHTHAAGTESGDARPFLLELSEALALDAGRATAVGSKVDAKRFSAGAKGDAMVAQLSLEVVAKLARRGKPKSLLHRNFEAECLKPFCEDSESGRQIADDDAKRPSKVLENIVDVDLQRD